MQIDEAKVLWSVVVGLAAGLATLGGLVWRNLHWRIARQEEDLRGCNASIVYLRETAHELRGLVPNPIETEARRRESRENFDRIFAMLRDIERLQNEMAGELKAKRDN